MFHVSLSGHEAIADLIAAMRKVRPPLVGFRVCPKWSLQGLLTFLNSAFFEPLEAASFDSQNKLITLICLNTGCRVYEVAAIDNLDYVRDEVEFSWPPGFLTKMKGRIVNWYAQPPIISPIDAQQGCHCPPIPPKTSSQKKWEDIWEDVWEDIWEDIWEEWEDTLEDWEDTLDFLFVVLTC